jgi:SAM-dependent methyltransferase
MNKPRLKPPYSARTADKFVLYQIAVQSPENEVAFIDRMCRNYQGGVARLFREDFCGTALISCEWAKKRKENEAFGVDLCADTLAWGRENNLSALKPDTARRVHLIQDDVRKVHRPKVDIVGAFNFSFYIFRTIPELIHYFKQVRASLRPGGLFVLDGYGGYEAQKVMKDRARNRGFTYIWDQAEYNPINDDTTCHIHFEFPDGTKMRRAFTYHWRLWTFGVIQDCLRAAGFKDTDVYWEGTTKKDKGDGVFRLQKKAENCAGWHAYIVALT